MTKIETVILTNVGNFKTYDDFTKISEESEKTGILSFKGVEVSRDTTDGYENIEQTYVLKTDELKIIGIISTKLLGPATTRTELESLTKQKARIEERINIINSRIELPEFALVEDLTEKLKEAKKEKTKVESKIAKDEAEIEKANEK